jgi:hypothetical protein
MAENNDVLEGEARRELEQHFGVEGAKDHDELDPPVPGRKGRVLAACACILGTWFVVKDGAQVVSRASNPACPVIWERARMRAHVLPRRHARVLLSPACVQSPPVQSPHTTAQKTGNEVCERLAYYGIQTNMGLYLKNYAGYPADQASQLLQGARLCVCSGLFLFGASACCCRLLMVQLRRQPLVGLAPFALPGVLPNAL